MTLISETTGKCNISETQIGCPYHVQRFFNPVFTNVFTQSTSKIATKVFGNSNGMNIKNYRQLFERKTSSPVVVQELFDLWYPGWSTLINFIDLISHDLQQYIVH